MKKYTLYSNWIILCAVFRNPLMSDDATTCMWDDGDHTACETNAATSAGEGLAFWCSAEHGHDPADKADDHWCNTARAMLTQVCALEAIRRE